MTTPGVVQRAWWRHPGVRVGGSLLVLAALFTVLPFSQLLAAIRRVPPATWPLALGAYMALHLIGVAKWRLLINAAGAGIGFATAAQAYYAGLFGNMFLPSLVGGDVVRAGIVLPRARSKSGLILGSLVDRLQDVVGLVAVASAGVALSPQALDARGRAVMLVLGALLASGSLAALATWRFFPARRLPFRVRRRVVAVRRAIRATAARPQYLVSALVLGISLQSLLVVLNWWLGRQVGIEIPLYVWFFVWPLAKLSGLLPLTQGGIGVREAAQAALFAPFGVPAVMAVAVGLVFEAVILAGGLLGGAIAFGADHWRAAPGSIAGARHAPSDPQRP